MIQIRHSMFETNSSSTDVFCIPQNASLQIPKEIKMSKLKSYRWDIDENASIENKLAFMYNKADCNHEAAAFIQYLVSKGINVVNDTSNDTYDDYMFGYCMKQEDLDRFLFDPTSMYLSSPSKEEYKKIPEDFDVLRYRE